MWPYHLLFSSVFVCGGCFRTTTWIQHSKPTLFLIFIDSRWSTSLNQWTGSASPISLNSLTVLFDIFQSPQVDAGGRANLNAEGTAVTTVHGVCWMCCREWSIRFVSVVVQCEFSTCELCSVQYMCFVRWTLKVTHCRKWDLASFHLL